MSKELVISADRHETKLAILEDDQLVEVFFQRANEYSLAGSIHKGRVTRVLPGMQSAFVDSGAGTRYVPLCLGLLRRERGFRSRADAAASARGRGRSGEAEAADVVDRTAAEEPAAAGESQEQCRSRCEPRRRYPAHPVRERSDRGDGRDRRGRRSRRRRTRGRGFPESKYASEPSRASRGPPPNREAR